MGRVGVRVGEIGVSNGFSMATFQMKIKRVTETMKIKAHTRSSFVGACARVGKSRSTCRVMAAVISWLTLSKMYLLCIG